MVSASPSSNPFRFVADRAALFGRYLFSGYDAIEDKKRRKPSTGLCRSEDAEANDAERKKLTSARRDIVRNFTIARWMIRRHLDYVTTFHFQAKTDNKALNTFLEELVAKDSIRENFDRAGRHPRWRALRIAEACRTIDGDVLAVRLNDGRLQWIEGDRIRVGQDMPDGIDRSRLVHGIQVDEAGRDVAYMVCKRNENNSVSGITGTAGGNFTFERLVSAQNAYLHSYYDRFDQYRGVSPITSALNEMRDVYESFDLARARQKVAQLFGLVVYREYYDDDDPQRPVADGDNRYTIDMGAGATYTELEPGDRAEFLESKTPALETQQFWTTMIAVAMKALDLPFSFYDESFTNYSGSRGAILQYDLSAENKRTENRDLLDWWTRWRLALHAIDGELPGVDFSALRWQWISRGMPWIDPLKEILASKEAVGMGVDTRTNILRQQGRDFEDVVAELAREADLLKAAGLPLNLDTNNALVAALTNESQPAKAA